MEDIGASGSASAEGGAPKGQTESPKREKLDVESMEERQERLGRLFISKSPSTPSSPNRTPNPFPSTRPEIGPLPASDILARVRNFLPLLASSNESLLQRAKENPESVDIENVKGDQRIIEMDLGLGVFDVKGEAGGDMGPEMDIPETRPSTSDDDDEEGEEEEDGEEDEDMDGGLDSSDTSSEGSDTDSDSESCPSTYSRSTTDK